MKLPNFRDAHPFTPVHSGYSATNEHYEAIHFLLGDERVPHVAGILGGGDIALTVIASRGTEQFSFVDHNYRSMATAMIKLLLVQACGGARGTKALLKLGFDAVQAVVTRLRTEMPELLRPHFTEKDGYHHQNWIVIMIEEWLLMPDELIEQLAERADRMTFIHGDLTDLPTFVDLLYLSNAMGHQGREGTPKIEDFTPHIKPGGRLLGAGGFSLPRAGHYVVPGLIKADLLPPGWTSVTAHHAPARGRMLDWHYWTLRRAN